MYNKYYYYCHPIWPPIVYVKVKCHFTAEIVRM